MYMCFIAYIWPFRYVGLFHINVAFTTIGIENINMLCPMFVTSTIEKCLKVDGVETTFRNRFMFVLRIKSDILIENATWILSSNARHDAVCFYQLEL